MYKEIIVNAITGEETKIQFTASEVTARKAKEAQMANELVEEQAKQLDRELARSAAEAKLLELGLTADDLKALLG
jgi:enoyl-CoA hydratase/carnithine racemase